MSDRVALRQRFAALVAELQPEYCLRLEAADGAGRFGCDSWQRPGGGGGLTRTLAEGEVFERAAVNASEVHGLLPERLLARLGGDGREFVAGGLSVIVHPRSPMVPTVHMNVRYLERGADAWFGGGADLTPSYLFEEDAGHFHDVLRQVCARHPEAASYPRFKQACDRYFWIRHRGEARGVGGLFFDELRAEPEATLAFVADLGRSFLAAYLPIVERRQREPWGERERRWQCLRRGRYVEFNLVYDRGTLFGLETDGRTESILVSMPPLARWEYAHEPEPGSRETQLLEVLRAPREWAG